MAVLRRWVVIEVHCTDRRHQSWDVPALACIHLSVLRPAHCVVVVEEEEVHLPMSILLLLLLRPWYDDVREETEWNGRCVRLLQEPAAHRRDAIESTWDARAARFIVPFISWYIARSSCVLVEVGEWYTLKAKAFGAQRMKYVRFGMCAEASSRNSSIPRSTQESCLQC